MISRPRCSIPTMMFNPTMVMVSDTNSYRLLQSLMESNHSMNAFSSQTASLTVTRKMTTKFKEQAIQKMISYKTLDLESKDKTGYSSMITRCIRNIIRKPIVTTTTRLQCLLPRLLLKFKKTRRLDLRTSMIAFSSQTASLTVTRKMTTKFKEQAIQKMISYKTLDLVSKDKTGLSLSNMPELL
jgi:chorismate mutase